MKGRCGRVPQETKPIQKSFLSMDNSMQCRLFYQEKSRKQTSECGSEISSAAFVHTCHSIAKGSFTLEAAVLVPLFTGFLVAILFFFRVIQIQENLYEAMVYTGRTISVTAFGENVGIGEEVLTPASYVAANAAVHQHYKSGFTDQDQAYRFLIGGMPGLSLIRSETAGDYIDLKADYRIKLPIDFFGTRWILGGQECKVRKWNGYQKDAVESEKEDDIWVYITPRGAVYHKDRNCKYLDLTIRSVERTAVDHLRNKDGSCYYPCEVCGNRKTGGAVYITDYGTSYHTSINCSGLRRSIQMVRLSECDRGPCSKCGM